MPSPATSALPGGGTRAGRHRLLHLQDGNPSEGAPRLRQALAIYQRIGAPDAQRVQETLLTHRTKAGNLTPAPER